MIFAALTTPALAQTPLEELETDCAISNIWCGTGESGVTCNKPIYDNAGELINANPCDFCDALRITRNITVLLMWFATIAAVIMIVVGALTMMFAAGSEERFATGKKTILNAVIGLAIALAAWLITNTFIQFLSPGDTSVPWDQIHCS